MYIQVTFKKKSKSCFPVLAKKMVILCSIYENLSENKCFAILAK